MRVFLALALSTAALTLTVFGCSSAVHSADIAGCQERAASLCQKLNACVHNGVSDLYGDEATCETRMKDNCDADIGASDSGDTAASISTCATAVPTASCDDFVSGIVDQCQPQPGSRATGKACGFSSQCGTTFCAIVEGTNCGTCANLSQPGDSCATTSCSPGLTCLSSTMTCQPLGGSGATCTASTPCAADLTCVTATGATSGTCTITGAVVGAACDPTHTTGADCNDVLGFACNSATNKCVAVTYAGAGQPCGNVSGTRVDCDNASVCVGSAGTTPGKCLALAIEGQPCDISAGPACMQPGRCVTTSASSTSGTCTLPAASCG